MGLFGLWWRYALYLMPFRIFAAAAQVHSKDLKRDMIWIGFRNLIEIFFIFLPQIFIVVPDQ